MNLKSVFAFAIVALVWASAIGGAAQTNPLPIGSVSPGAVLGLCAGNPQVPNNAMFGANMTCADLTLTGCQSVQPLNAIYGYYVPANPAGTIVMFSSGSGTTPSENFDEETTYINDYEKAGFAVVQIEWASPWQDPNNGPGGNILAAACRPATFLSWVNGNPALHPQKAMCAQGASAGSAAIVYALAWYGGNAYLVAVELLSGPVLSKIDQGCTYPNAENMSICSLGQYGCTAKTIPWTDNVIYTPTYNVAVAGWSGLSPCATSGVNTMNYPLWAAMSIVDGSFGGATPTYSYPTTSVHGWICQDYAFDKYHDRLCFPPHCPNNSASQGNYFYEQLDIVHAPHFGLTGVQACVQEEGVSQGTDPDANSGNGGPAMASIELDLENNCAVK